MLRDIRRRNSAGSAAPLTLDQAQTLEAEALIAHSEASQRTRLDSGRVLLRDALSYERNGWRIGTSGNLFPSGVSEVRDAARPDRPDSLGERSTSSNDGRSPLPAYMLTPPHTSEETSTRSSPYVSTPPSEGASLTSRFAPAHRLDGGGDVWANVEREETINRLLERMAEMRDGDEREYIASHVGEISRMRDRNPDELSLEYREAEMAYLETVQTRLEHDPAEVHPVRRGAPSTRAMLWATHTSPQQSSLDGLGDRERSPDDDRYWETMLSTITPDQRAPTTHSSFTSTTASASSLTSSSALSQGTLISTPSTSADNPACPIEIGDSEDDPIDAINAQIVRARSQANRIQNLSQRLTQEHYRDEHQARRRRMQEREDELQQMEANIRRLERRISEERPPASERHGLENGRSRRERL